MLASHVEIVTFAWLETWPSRRWDVEREIRRRIETRLEQHGIKAAPIVLPGDG